MDEAKRPDWAAIRAAYEAGADSIDNLCKTYDISRWDLYRHRHEEAWQPRKKSARRLKSPTEPGRGEENPRPRRQCLKPKKSRKEMMIVRFFEALERQMHDIERGLKIEADSVETNAGTRERDARTLSSLVRTLEKLIVLDTGSDPEVEARKEAAHRDIEGLRQALADRIARLGRRGKD